MVGAHSSLGYFRKQSLSAGTVILVFSVKRTRKIILSALFGCHIVLYDGGIKSNLLQVAIYEN